MLQIKATKYVNIVILVHKNLREVEREDGPITTEERERIIRESGGSIESGADVLNPLCITYWRDLKRDIVNIDRGIVADRLSALLMLIHMDLGSKWFYYIPSELARHFDATAEGVFGQEFVDRFPSAVFDWEEGSKCLAQGRNTAAVFHFIRVAELSARALALSLGHIIDPLRSNTMGYGAYDAYVRDAISGSVKPTVSHWPAEKAWYVEAQASYHAIKDAWRNGTMHLEKKYLDHEAEGVMAVVKSIVLHTAKRIDEYGDWKP